ncbi:class IV adenylate cyclase [Bacteroidota bacterium]
MAIEYETKVLDIDKEEILKKLKSLGAEIGERKLQKRWVFHMGENWWIRLRDDGYKIMITYKSRKGTGISNTEEIEVEVSDFKEAYKIFSSLGFKAEYYQENYRIMCKHNDIEFCIDEWPQIPVLLEIEGTSEEKVKEGLKLLGLEGKDIGNIGTLEVYSKHNIDLHGVNKLTF